MLVVSGSSVRKPFLLDSALGRRTAAVLLWDGAGVSW